MKWLGLVVLGVLVISFSNLAHADPRTDISNKMCEIVNLVKYLAGAVALLAMAIVGIEYMTVGSNPIRRDELKTRLVMIAAGMFLILISNYIVSVFLPDAASCPLLS